MTAAWDAAEAARLAAVARDVIEFATGPWASIDRRMLRAIADQLEAAGAEVERWHAERDSLRHQLESRTGERDSYRGMWTEASKQLEAAQASRDSFLERHDIWMSEATGLAAAQQRIAELEQIVVGNPVALGALLKAKDQRIAELEAEAVEADEYWAKRLNELEAENAQLTAALRAIAPVYRAAVDEDREAIGAPSRAHDAAVDLLESAISTARAALTPDLQAVIERACKEGR